MSRLDDDKNKPLEINIEQDEWDNSFEDDFNKINEIIDKLEYSTLVDYYCKSLSHPRPIVIHV